jgi:hypothetical protein
VKKTPSNESIVLKILTSYEAISSRDYVSLKTSYRLSIVKFPISSNDRVSELACRCRLPFLRINERHEDSRKEIRGKIRRRRLLTYDFMIEF